MWTQPQTEEQKKYYSKHAPKRRVYGIFMAMLQTGHGALAFAAWMSIYSWGLGKIPALLFLVPFLAAGSLLVLHLLFRTTWDVYWYDRLDKDDKTDSSWAIPIAILIVLIGTEIFGAIKFLHNQVEQPKVESAAAIDTGHGAAIAGIDRQYQNTESAIKKTYESKRRAATLPYDRRIRSMRNRRADTQEERRYINNQVASLEAQRDAALAPVLAEESQALATNLAESNNARAFESSRRDKAVSAIDTRNEAEQARYTDDMGSVSTYAWIFSIVLVVLIAALGYGRVRINVKSGILPLRNYTVLDAHGSALERIYTAFADAFNRRSLQFAVALHKGLSPSEAITSFDGTVVSRPGTYNTPAGFFPPGKTIDQAAVEVMQKIALFQKNNPGYKPTQADYDAELKRAMALNGSYPGAPYQGDVGKASPPPVAEAQPSGESTAPGNFDAPACQTVSDRISEYEPGKTPSMPLLIADLDKWAGRARQCWRRAHPLNTEVKSKEKQYDNQVRAEKYAALIETFGNRVEWRNGPNASDHEVIFHNLGWTDDMVRANVERFWPAIYNTLKYLGELKPDKQPVDLL